MGDFSKQVLAFKHFHFCIFHLPVILTHFIFGVLSIIPSHLLQRDYSFLGDINIWPPLVTIGIYSSTISAAMSNLIGASRILYALSKDNLFGEILEQYVSCCPMFTICFSWCA